jgi:RNA polymerase sigma-70 factor (ECF subfamily)
MRIAVNLVRDDARNRRLQFWRRAPADSADRETVWNCIRNGEIDAERRILVKEQVDAVWSATARLPERQRTVFLLRYLEEMALIEIAAVTGLKEGTVKVHLFRALRSVRAQVGRLR